MAAETVSSPYLIVGLGNPGPKYALTRHNIGFIVVDLLAQRWPGVSYSSKFHGEFAQTKFKDEKVFLLKPQTFMNRSGISVAEAATFYKVDLQKRFLVVYDDIDLPTGNIRIRPNGSSGGHNGMKSLIECLGTEDFPRLRVGVGRSAHGSAADHVLEKISKAEQNVFMDCVNICSDAVEMFIQDGISKSMNTFNSKKTEKNDEP